MLQTLTKLAQKPTDKQIRLTRVVFALILIAVIVLGWNVTRTEWGLPTWIKYALFIFPAVGLVRGIIDPGLFRKKIWKWTVFGLGAAMLLTSLFLIEDQPYQTGSTIQPTVSGELNIASLQNAAKAGSNFTLSTDNWFAFFGVIIMIVGFLLNSRNITSKNERYGEKVTKIRV